MDLMLDVGGINVSQRTTFLLLVCCLCLFVFNGINQALTVIFMPSDFRVYQRLQVCFRVLSHSPDLPVVKLASVALIDTGCFSESPKVVFRLFYDCFIMLRYLLPAYNGPRSFLLGPLALFALSTVPPVTSLNLPKVQPSHALTMRTP